MQNEWDGSGAATTSLLICRDALIERIKTLQSKYPQYEGLYDEGHGWKLATPLEPILFKGTNLEPGMVVIARPEIHNGQMVIHAESVVDGVYEQNMVYAWIVSAESATKIYFLEK